MSNLDTVAGLKPEKLWYHFAKISEIPRGSGNETEVLEYIKNFAKEKGLEFQQDSIGNVVIRKEATPGYEDYPGVVLQGHVDMVCEKNKETDHDFEKDPIKLLRDGDFITADGTTLGADNGIGVAAALAVLDDDSVEHGPVEALFTVDEETGLTGAFNLDPEMLKHRYLLNLDSEEDAELFVGCAGGKDTVGKFAKELMATEEGRKAYKLVVTGLKGGHSGLDIDKGLANAIRLLGRVLKKMYHETHLHIAGIEGGSKRNAIPREAEAVITVDAEYASEINVQIDYWQKAFEAEYGITEPGLKIVLEKTELPKKVLTHELTGTIINTLFLIPHGIAAMSQSIPGLVETSTNLATVEEKENEVWIGTSQRSSISSAIEDIALRVKTMFEILGAEVETGKAYPGWQPNLDSKVLKIATESIREIIGRKPEIKAIHAGLECGIIGEKFPGMEMISFGPTIMGAHSPDEKVSISAVEKFWSYLLNMLKKVNRPV